MTKLNRTVKVFVWIGLLIAGLPGWASPIVIAHRGASGYLPEHTLEAYAMGYAQGADYIEPDLVMTKDGRFICAHDIHLEHCTNVADVFPEKKREDGRWYAADLTLAEIKQLRARERTAARFPAGKASFEVATFEEMIELVQGLNATTGREVGIYPELKDPEWHAAQGLCMESALIDVLRRYGYEGPDAKVFVQCFWPSALIKMREMGSRLPQILLLGDDERSDRLVAAPETVDYVKGFANGIGPAKERIEANPELVRWAHDRGLLVHIYTLNAQKVLVKYSSLEEETRQYYFGYGVDGAFSDYPDRTVRVVRERR